MSYTKEELEKILENDFLLDPCAFGRGRTNDDVVDSMLICHVLEREWTELFAKWVDNYTFVDKDGVERIKHTRLGEDDIYGKSNYFWELAPRKMVDVDRILEHYERVKKWLKQKENTYKPGDMRIMIYAINY